MRYSINNNKFKKYRSLSSILKEEENLSLDRLKEISKETKIPLKVIKTTVEKLEKTT